MPLKVFLRGETYFCRGVVGPPDGRKRIYKSTGVSRALGKARAEVFAVNLEKQIWDEAVFGKRAIVSYAEAAAGYIELAQPGIRDINAIGNLVKHFGTQRLVEVMVDGGQAKLDDAIAAICAPDAAPDTKTRAVRTPHVAILNHAARRGWCSAPKFESPEQGEKKTDWLRPVEAQRLIDAAGKHLRPLLVFLFGTGARVGEALSLSWDDVDLKAGTAVFWEDKTKAGKKRVAKLSPAAVVELANLTHRDGAVFRRPGTKARPIGEPYAAREDGDGGGQFKNAWAGACKRAGLPGDEIAVKRVVEWTPVTARKMADGTTIPGMKKTRVITSGRFAPKYSPHITRHSFSTWFQAATKDPMRLRDEGGWSTVALVERYAHRMKEEDVPSIAVVWGVAHPDFFPAAMRASAVHGNIAQAQ